MRTVPGRSAGHEPAERVRVEGAAPGHPGALVDRDTGGGRGGATAAPSGSRPSVVSTRSAVRFAERVRARRALTRRRAAIVAGAGAAAGALGWLLLLSPVLALEVDQLVVAGEGGVVDRADVVEVVTTYAGTPLPRLDTVGLRRELLGVPGVRGAEVTREWPDGLRVVVTAREPVAAVPVEGGEGGVVLLDREGVQVGRAEEAPAGLPVVAVPLDEPGGRALTAVLGVLEQLPDDLRADVTGVSARSRDTVRLELVDGRRVEWGSADQTALKSEVLQTLRDSGAADGANVIDVSAPTLPITRS